MADPLSAASSVVALVTFGVQATSALTNIIVEYKRAPSTIRQLKSELNDLSHVLESLKGTVEQEPGPAFEELKVPLFQCAKACRDFETILARDAGKSQGARANFQDWTKLKYHGSDINAFKETISGYKATMSIALGNANLRTQKVTVGVFREWKTLITDTTYDLQNRLRDIDAKLGVLVPSGGDGNSDGSTVKVQMEGDKYGILKCLEICEVVSVQITKLERTHSTPSDDPHDQAAKSAASEFIAAGQPLAGWKRNLENERDELMQKVQEISGPQDSEVNRTQKRAMVAEADALQKSINFCNKALEDADRNRSNVFEDISMGDDGRQVVASTVGDLIFARSVKAGARSVQVLGQVSNETIQHTTNSISVNDANTHSQISGKSYQSRYGIGRELRSQPSFHEQG